MGDWEEFCESKGMNAGCPDDYDGWLDSLDGPAAKPKLPSKEIKPTLSQEALLSLLVSGACHGGLDLRIEAEVPCPLGGEYEGLGALDDHPDEPVPNLSLRIEHKAWVPFTFLIDTLRTKRVPVMHDEGGWVAWDDRDQRLKCAPPPLHWLWLLALAKRPEESMDERELKLMRLLHRALLSTDHGKKPVLLQRDFLHDAIHRREVEFMETRRISSDAIDRYVLAYYDSAGNPGAVPLAEAAELGFPIFTRCGAYRWRDGDLDPFLNSDAQMVAGAFVIATKFNPNQFEWFLARERGSIFQSAIERIAAPKNPHEPPLSQFWIPTMDAQKRRYTSEGSGHALSAAEGIMDWASEIGTVYMTGGGHPFDTDAVTTPELYLHALETLSRLGYEVRYTLRNGVTVDKQKANDEPPVMEIPF